MTNCLKCTKELLGAVKSSVKDDGSYYLICRNCGNVMQVTVDESTGLTTIHHTLEGYSKEVKDQMIEAKNLFESAGVEISEYIALMNSERHSAIELKEDIDYDNVKEEVNISIKEIVSSISDTVGIKEIELEDEKVNKISDLIIKEIKQAINK